VVHNQSFGEEEKIKIWWFYKFFKYNTLQIAGSFKPINSIGRKFYC